MPGPFGVELPENLGSESTDSGSETAPETSSSAPDTAPETVSSGTSGTQPTTRELVELDKLERFRYGGREWTPAELKKSILRQQDYTRKNQEVARTRQEVEQVRQEAANEKKFASNFQYDLRKVIAQPALLSEMRKIYPRDYTEAAEQVLRNLGLNEQAGSSPQGAQIDPVTRAKLAEHDEFIRNQQAREQEASVQATERELDAKFQTLSKKYPNADPEVVNNRALAYIQMNQKPVSDKMFEAMFKQHHEQVDKRITELQRQKVEAQKKANAKGRDIGPGGGTPGGAPKKMTIKEATKAAIEAAESGALRW